LRTAARALWQVYTTRWEPGHGVTLLYYDVDRIRSRLDDVGDDLEDPEDLLSDDDDVERSSPTEVRAWVDEYQTQAQAQAQAPMPALPPRGGGGACRHFGIFRPRSSVHPPRPQQSTLVWVRWVLSMTVREVRRQFGAIRRPVSSCNGRTGAGGGMLTVQTTVRERG